jgi:Ca2+-binding EF-hand superfamily protein
MSHSAYSKEELSALRGIFALYDPDGSGAIAVRELEGLLQKIGHSTESAGEILTAADSAVGGKDDGVITFDEFLELLQKGQPDQPGEQPDPKVRATRLCWPRRRVRAGCFGTAARARRR